MTWDGPVAVKKPGEGRKTGNAQSAPLWQTDCVSHESNMSCVIVSV